MYTVPSTDCTIYRELAVRVKEKGLGMKVGNKRLSLLMYANDIIMTENDND